MLTLCGVVGGSEVVDGSDFGCESGAVYGCGGGIQATEMRRACARGEDEGQRVVASAKRA